MARTNITTDPNGAIPSTPFLVERVGAGPASPYQKIAWGPADQVNDVTPTSRLPVEVAIPAGTPLPVNLGATIADPVPAAIVSTSGLPALHSSTDSVASRHATDYLHNGADPIIPRRVAFSRAAGAGDGAAIVAPISGKSIRVLQYTFVGSAAATFKFRGGNVDLTGPMPIDARDGIASPFVPYGILPDAPVGQPLYLHIDVAGVTAGGHLVVLDV